jgi:hypothetical protein
LDDNKPVPTQPSVNLVLWAGLCIAMGAVLVSFALVQKWRARRLDDTTTHDSRQTQHVIGALQAIRELLEDLESRTSRLEARCETIERSLVARPSVETRPTTHEPRQVLRLSLEQQESQLASATSQPMDGFRERVFSLADEGLSPVQIAREVGRPTGQVELVLNLRRAGLSARG